MPSIFIWKATEPNDSKKTIRYYAGSNWALEDNEFSPKSYIFLNQVVIPGFGDSVITYQVKQMPQNWIGSELLEVSCVPFETIKSDNYGTLDKIGNWMRFTSTNEIDFNKTTLEKELILIKQWMTQKKSINNMQTSTNPVLYLDSNIVHQKFQDFLNKYSIPPNNKSYYTNKNITKYN